MSFEESLICHASPTLANIKVANLYSFRFSSMAECQRSIAYFNSMMNPKGIFIELLKNDGDFYLIYVYRKARLRRELAKPGVREFLGKLGYPIREAVNCLGRNTAGRPANGPHDRIAGQPGNVLRDDSDIVLAYLEVLRRKVNTEKDFPHEIGVFLGYPLEDVKAFIATNGQNCTACGEWKVYHDEKSAQYIFCKYKHCKEIYMKVYCGGRKLSDMLVGDRALS